MKLLAITSVFFRPRNLSQINPTGRTSMSKVFVGLVISLIFGEINASYATVFSTDVPFISQRAYPRNMRESACAPTSIAMIIRYHFPGSQVDMPEVYHSGTQAYSYGTPNYSSSGSGLSIGYSNISDFPSLGDYWRSQVIDQYERYFYVDEQVSSTGASWPSIATYLQSMWGFQTSEIGNPDHAPTASEINTIYSAIKAGRPLLGRVWAHGNTSFLHYVVIRGIDDGGEPNNPARHTIYINDPYDIWSSQYDVGGNNKAIPYNQFFVSGAHFGGRWFRQALDIIPPAMSTESRARTVLVDTGHNTFASGNSKIHSFSLDDPSKWYMYYGNGGDWYYSATPDRAARWTPKLSAPGKYRVTSKFKASTSGGNVTYTVYDVDGVVLSGPLTHNHSGSTWTSRVIADSVNLLPGSYVRASSISAQSNIDAMQFEYLGPAIDDLEVASLTSAQHSASWAYYQSPNRDQWYISNQLGATYMLGNATGYGSGEMIWGSLGYGVPIASLDFRNSSVSVFSTASALTSASSFPAVSVSSGQSLTIYSNAADAAARKINGATLPVDWYFFQVESTRVWYIVNVLGSETIVYRLKLNSSNTNYDWVKVSNANWSRNVTVGNLNLSAQITLRSR